MATPKKPSRLMQILNEEGFKTSTGKRYTPEGRMKKDAADKQRLTGGKSAKTGAEAKAAINKFAGKQSSNKSTSTASNNKSKTSGPAKSTTPKAKSKTTNPGGPASLGTKLTPAERRAREKAISTKEGATKTVGGVKFKYIRGEWQRVKRNGYTPG